MGEKEKVKVTIMKLKVDLQCDKCYKKVKKVLCKFPQIRDQVYDEKNNIVTITVVCCNPEKIRDKICCKGCGAIKSIEILEPPPPPKPKPSKEHEKPKEKPPPPPEPKPEPTKEHEKPKEKPPPPPQPQPQPMPNRPPHIPVCPPPPHIPVCPQPQPQPQPMPPPPPHIPVCPPPMAVPIGVCCTSCYEGREGGPCFHGYGGPPPPAVSCYDGYYGRPIYDSYGGSRPCCDEYLCEDNASACTIM